MASTKKIQQFEVYWAEFDPGIGSEMRKASPCIVVSPDIMNNLLNTVLVVPLTKTVIDWPFRLVVRVNENESSAACDHLRSISKNRFGDKISVLEPTEQDRLLNVLQDIFTRPGHLGN